MAENLTFNESDYLMDVEKQLKREPRAKRIQEVGALVASAALVTVYSYETIINGLGDSFASLVQFMSQY